MRLKSSSVILLIVTVAGVALFGFTMIEHSMSHETGGCIASMGRVAPCPETAGSIPTDFLAFHLEVLKVFFVSSDFVRIVSALLLILVLTAFQRLKFLWRAAIVSVGRLAAREYDNLSKSVTPLQINLRQWLGRHEKRDPIDLKGASVFSRL